MPIVNKQGRSLAAPRLGKVKLGTPKEANRPGKNQPCFRVESDYIPGESITAVLGDKPTELTIHFPKFYENDDEARQFIYDSAYKAYKGGVWFCAGNGEVATRNTKEGPTEVACTCPMLAAKECKQQGELRFAIQGFPAGGYFQMITHSWKGISNLQNALDIFYSYLGKNFWNARFILFKHKITQKGHANYIVGIKLHPDYQKLAPDLGQQLLEDEDENAPIQPFGASEETETKPPEEEAGPPIPDQPDEVAPQQNLTPDEAYALKVLDYCNKSGVDAAMKGMDKMLNDNTGRQDGEFASFRQVMTTKMLADNAKHATIKKRAAAQLKAWEDGTKIEIPVDADVVAEALKGEVIERPAEPAQPEPTLDTVESQAEPEPPSAPASSEVVTLSASDKILKSKLVAKMTNYQSVTGIDAKSELMELCRKELDSLNSDDIKLAFKHFEDLLSQPA